jgi:serine/threonine protein kinase
MSYCINPNCSAPDKNSTNTNVCLSCGTNILLKDRYRAQQLLGQGGFGKTFKATDEDRPRKPLCVIKQFAYSNADAQTQQVALQLFYEEAQHLEALGSHPQIPRLLAYFDVAGQSYLVQEFIDGQNLQQELNSNGSFDQEKVRELLVSLLPILDFLHSRSIPVIHRDLKPANIIRRHSDNQLVLVDFGAAKQATQTMLAKTGTKIGSPEYSAPEQIRGKPTFASDIFSLGVTCIHLLTQVSPFDLFDVHSDVWIWRDYLDNDVVDRQLGEVLDKMIANSLPQRYQSAVEVLQALNIEQKSTSSSNSLLDQSAEVDPQNAEDYNCRALSKLDRDFSGALADFNKAIKLDPKHAIAYSNRGLLKKEKLNDVSGALADFNKAIELDPELAIAYSNRGLLKKEKLNDVSGALADLNKVNELNDAIDYKNRGDSKRHNDASGALADFNKAIELNPRYVGAYRDRGWLKGYKLNDLSGALADYSKVIELDPEDANAYYNRGWLKHKLSCTKGFDRLKLWARSYFGRGRFKLNDVSGALADFNKAIKLNPRYVGAYRERGWLKHDMLNDVSGALADYSKAIELDPEDANAYYCRGQLRADRIKDSTGAIQDFRQSASLYRQQDGTSKYIQWSINYLQRLGVTE